MAKWMKFRAHGRAQMARFCDDEAIANTDHQIVITVLRRAHGDRKNTSLMSGCPIMGRMSPELVQICSQRCLNRRNQRDTSCSREGPMTAINPMPSQALGQTVSTLLG
jgi:hypothetical protein